MDSWCVMKFASISGSRKRYANRRISTTASKDSLDVCDFSGSTDLFKGSGFGSTTSETDL